MLRLYNLQDEEILILRASKNNYINGEAYEIRRYQEAATGVKELSFILPAYIRYESDLVENERWKYIQTEMLVKYKDKNGVIDVYKIKEIEDKYENGQLISNITCKHIAYDLNKQFIEDTIDITGTPDVIMSAILSGTSWSIGTISASLSSKIRTLTSENKSVLEMLNAVAALFKAYLRFNGDYTIDLLDSLTSKSESISFRYGKNIKSIKRTINSENQVTRLYLYGYENLTFSSVSPTKLPYIQDFSYYLQTGQMPSNAEQIIDQYDADMLVVNTNIENVQTSINELKTDLIPLESQLQYKEELLAAKQQLLQELDAKIALTDPSDLSYPTLLNEKSNTQTEINNLMVQVSSLNTQINDLQTSISSYEISLTNYLTQRDNIENNFRNILGKYIHIGREIKDDIVDPQELYDEAVTLIKKICYPTITYELTIADLSKQVGYEIETIDIGSKISVYDELLKLDTELEITKMTEVVDNWEDTKIEVGNMNTVFEDLFKRIVDSANTVKNKQSNWDNNTKTVQQALAEAIEAQKLANTALQRADGKIATFSQAVMPHPEYINIPENSEYDNYVGDLWYDTTSDKTYWYEKSPNGSNYDYKWVEKNIPKKVFDKIDGKSTVFYNTPTPPYHVGDLWRRSPDDLDFLICNTERLTGDYNPADWGLATNVGETISNIEQDIANFSNDLILTLAEANSLGLLLDNLLAESTEIIAMATGLGITTEKTNFENALIILTNYLNNNWLDKTYPLPITAEQRANVITYFRDVEAKKSTLIKKITEVQDAKAQSYADMAENNANQHTDNVISPIAQRLTTAETNIMKNANEIALKASIETVNGLGERLNTAEASISLNAQEIALKVSKDNIISSINQSAEAIRISAEKIDLVGAVTFSVLDTDLQTKVNRGNTAKDVVDSWGYGGTTYIDGDKIYTGTLSASKITTGTLDASKVTVTNLNADNITSGSISANRIRGGTITGVNINVDTDINVGNSININVGSGYNINKGIFFEDRSKITYYNRAMNLYSEYGITLESLYGDININALSASSNRWVKISGDYIDITSKYGSTYKVTNNFKHDFYANGSSKMTIASDEIKFYTNVNFNNQAISNFRISILKEPTYGYDRIQFSSGSPGIKLLSGIDFNNQAVSNFRVGTIKEPTYGYDRIEISYSGGIKFLSSVDFNNQTVSNLIVDRIQDQNYTGSRIFFRTDSNGDLWFKRDASGTWYKLQKAA